MSQQPEVGQERPSRYNRTFGGLIAAMIATVLFVGCYVGFRALTRDQPDVRAEPVDYLSSVSDLQRAGTDIVYPPVLPAGWYATSVRFERGTPPDWRIGFLTDRGEFVGVVQQQADVDDLLEEYVDEHTDQGADAAPENTLGAPTWQTWSDDGGDHALSAEVADGPLAGQTLLVYGSAPLAEQQAFVTLLSTDPAPAG